MTSAHVAILISTIAVFISLVSLWWAHLRPFKLSIFFDSPRLSLYKITPEISGTKSGETWWIPSFDLGISFVNLGKRTGFVHDIRIVATLLSHRSEKKLYFYPKWIVDYSKFNKMRTERFEWVEEAIVREWYPICLGSEKDQTLHLILEGDRIDHKESGKIHFVLQVATSEKSGWRILSDFNLIISAEDYDSKSSCAPFNKTIEALRKME